MNNIAIEIETFDNINVFDKYNKVWSNASSRNPFISPLTLKLQSNNKIEIAFFYRHGELFGAIPFIKNERTLKMVGESKSDSIEIPFIKGTAIHQKYEAILCFILNVAPSCLAFKKLCDINLNALLFVKAFNALAYHHAYVPSWKNLFVKNNNQPFNSAIFLKNFNRGNTRNYSNKFKKEQNYSINVIQKHNSNDISKWMDYFYMYHELRWSQSNTPSIYTSQAERDELEKKVSNWIEEGCGMLFSLDVDDKPVSMAICLINNESLIYHQIAYKATPEILKYRINKILIFELSKWMIDNKFEILDFGVGNEPYKYEYTKLERRIIRLYASKSIFSKIYLKGVFDFHYQKRPRLQMLLNNYLRVYLIRIKLLISSLRNKMIPLFGLIKSDRKQLIEKIRRKWSKEVQIFYQFQPNLSRIKKDDSVSIKIASSNEVIKFYQAEIELSLQKRIYYLKKMEEGLVIPYAIVDKDSNVLSIAWTSPPKETETPANFVLNHPIVIIDCFTSKNHRGKGYYPILIRHIALQHQGDSLIYTNDWNIASQKGIIKAGFEYVAKRIKKNSNTYEWQ